MASSPTSEPPRPAARPRDERLPAAPHLYRLVLGTFLFGTAVLLVAAAFIPAPLDTRADLGTVPNPVKAAWFLIWIQEVVSYAVAAVYPVGLVTLVVVFWPYLDHAPPTPHARWLSPERRRAQVAGLLLVIGVLVWTFIGLYLRGPDWHLTPSF